MRPASTIGFSRSAFEPMTSSSRHGNAALREGDTSAGADGALKPPDWLVEWDKQRDSTASELYVSCVCVCVCVCCVCLSVCVHV